MFGQERACQEKEMAVFHPGQKVLLAGRGVTTWGDVGEEVALRVPMLVYNRDGLLAQVPQSSTTTIKHLPTTPISYHLR